MWAKIIRTLLLATSFLAAAPVTASAEVVFVGTIINTAVTPQCQRNGVGDRYPSVFHPKGSGNENFSGLSWITGYYATGHQLAGKSFNSTFQTVETGGVGWGNTYFRPEGQFAQIMISSSDPAIGDIDKTTKTVILRGKIKRLFNDGGGLACVVTFTGTYVKDTFEAGS